jgi:uncharacterized protein (DUF362 family)
MNDQLISIAGCGPEARYTSKPPFDPDAPFPENPFPLRIGGEPNRAYWGVRESLRLLGLDRSNFGTPAWNPLGSLVRPGDCVFLKPNMIRQAHEHCDDWEYVITHGSVVRAVLDYVFIALQGQGTVMIGDGPQTDSRFEQIVERMGLAEIQALYRTHKQFAIQIIDLRNEYWVERDGIYVKRIMLQGDPRGKVAVDLGGASMFSELDGQGKQYYGAYYDIRETNRHHCDGRHEYAVSRSPLTADVFINLPKLKTHKKCGLTVNLKSLVGINADKNWLPHYAFGSPGTGGDQFDKQTRRRGLENTVVRTVKSWLSAGSPFARSISRKTKKLAYGVFGSTDEVIRSGNWHGNDTVWRMCLDLFRILLYSDKDGRMGDTKSPKRYFCVVDGLVAMEGNGPMAGTPKRTGIILSGTNPVAVDLACATVMGFDFRRLPIINRAFEDHLYPLAHFQPSDVTCASNEQKWSGQVLNWEPDALFRFQPHFGWRGHIESEPGVCSVHAEDNAPMRIS